MFILLCNVLLNIKFSKSYVFVDLPTFSVYELSVQNLDHCMNIYANDISLAVTPNKSVLTDFRPLIHVQANME